MTIRNTLLRVSATAAGIAGWCLAAISLPAAETVVPSVPSAAARAETQSNTEILLRGPIHEAFAAHVDANVTAGVVVPKEPPAPINEMPPQMRPTGDDVAWIPGYWNWDDQRRDFIWISGTWRQSPPNHRWVPGYWSRADNGYRWIAGTWLAADANAVAYVRSPQQASLERGPSSPQPSDKHFWIPGVWRYAEGQYQWRPGYWAEGQANWMWMPDHYVWTPRGAVFVDGYWDYGLSDRGVLFAPAYFHAGVDSHLRFTPTQTIDTQAILPHLFVRPEYHHYYFGDYYGREYAGAGISPWFQFNTAARGYDPLLTYFVWQNGLTGVDAIARLSGWHAFFLNHADLRPPHDLTALTQFAIGHKGIAEAQFAVLGRPLDGVVAAAASTARPFVQLTDAELRSVLGTTGQLATLAQQRLNLELRTGGAVGSVVGATGGVLQLPRIANPLAAPGVGLPAVRVPAVGVPGVGLPGVGVPGVSLPGIGGGGRAGGIIGGRGGLLGGGGDDDDGDDD